MIKVRLIFFFIAIVLLPLSSCKKDINGNIENNKNNILKAEELKKNKGYGVVNVNNLHFRSGDDLNSKTLRFLNKGTIVSIIKKNDTRVKIGEMEDYWYQIEYEGITGWVFGYFIDIYSSFNNAKIMAKQYFEISEKEEKPDFFYDESINNNFFFLTNGKIFQLINGENGTNKILTSEIGLDVVSYFFSNNPDHIYYIAKKSIDYNGNGHLYKYNIKTENNELLVRNVYAADINKKKNKILLLTIQRTINVKYWLIRLLDLEEPDDIKIITKIKMLHDNAIKEHDTFILTLSREMGALSFLKLNEEGNFIYFKPSEENLTYIISILNGEYIKVEKEQEEPFFIDDSQFITTLSDQDENGEILYSIMLNDKISGRQKLIISSKLYPLNFSISPRKNYLGISMINLNKTIDKYYHSQVFILSLSTYSLTQLAPEGASYQPKWSNILLR